MGALAATIPSRAGTLSPGAAVSASDTISAALLSSKGVYLEIINAGAGADNITISDFSTTSTGAQAAALAPSVANGTSKSFLIKPDQGDPANSGTVTITHSQPAGVTYKLTPREV